MDIEISEALLLDERGEVSLGQLAECSALSEAEVRELVDYGALAPVNPAAAPWSFGARALLVARTAGRLRREFDLDAHAVSVLLGFVERIDELEAELRALRAGVAR